MKPKWAIQLTGLTTVYWFLNSSMIWFLFQSSTETLHCFPTEYLELPNGIASQNQWHRRWQYWENSIPRSFSQIPDCLHWNTGWGLLIEMMACIMLNWWGWTICIPHSLHGDNIRQYSHYITGSCVCTLNTLWRITK